MDKPVIFSIAPVEAPAASKATLYRSIHRVLTFVDAVETSKAIRDPLAAIGLTKKELHGVKKLVVLFRQSTHEAPPAPPVSANVVAMRSCEAFLAKTMPPARGKLLLRFPAQFAFVFDSIDLAARGTDAAITCGLVIDRMVALRSGAARKSTRKEDRAALAAVAETGLTMDRMEKFRPTVHKAMEETPTSRPGPDTTPAQEERVEILRRLHAWYSVWSDLARGVITRRDHLIRLGLASRRPRKAKAPVPAPAPAIEAAPISTRQAKGPDSRVA